MIEHHFREFLKKFPKSRPFLLALSGGPDSMSLFHLLKKMDVPFEVAHVDHKWRATSSVEAEKIAELCQKNSIAFHLKELSIKGANLEDRCRQARFDFFKALLSPKMGGVLLGHHAGDLVETVLKRLLEGARLTKLAGLRAETSMNGMMLYRPLLTVPKREILKWLEKHDYWFVEDETNHDPRFLRSRLRDSLIPELEKVFGKRIETSLVRLARSSLDLETDVLKRIQAYPMTSNQLDLREKCPESEFEWQMTVSNFFEKAGETVSSHTINQLIDHLKKRHSSKVLRLKNCYVKIDGRLLLIKRTN